MNLIRVNNREFFKGEDGNVYEVVKSNQAILDFEISRKYIEVELGRLDFNAKNLHELTLLCKTLDRLLPKYYVEIEEEDGNEIGDEGGYYICISVNDIEEIHIYSGEYLLLYDALNDDSYEIDKDMVIYHLMSEFN